MDLDTLRLLRRTDADNLDRVEHPESYDWSGAMAQVRELIPIVEHLTGRTFAVDEQVQDASYLTDLATYDVVKRPGKHTELVAVLAIRFSNFGRMFTVWWNTSTPLPAETVSRVIDVVRERGYLYVDSAALDASYSGGNPRWKGVSWYTRFFSYV
jgi:hypothetical protein